MSARISAKTPRGAANATARAIRQLAGGETVTVRPTEYGNGWRVVWEMGPYEWTLAATGGEDIFNQEYYADGYTGSEPTFLFDKRLVFAEPQNSYSLNFWKA